MERFLTELRRGLKTPASEQVPRTDSLRSDQTLSGLAEAWRVAALSRKVRTRDAKRWKAVVLRFQKWLGHDDLRLVVASDVQRSRTITSSRIVALAE